MKNKGTFLGRPLAQTPYAINFWENLLYKRKVKRIIDIGTYNGNFSQYLYLYCKEKDAEFFTFDIAKFETPIAIRKDFHCVDVFENIKQIGQLIEQKGLSVIFCDGGDKPREAREFTPYLKNGDIMVVHDWGTEITFGDIPENLKIIPNNTEEKMTAAFEKI